MPRPRFRASSRLLDKDDGHGFHDVVLALTRIGAPPVRKLLDSFLRDPGSNAGDELAGLGPLAREAVPALRAALTDKRPQARFSAAVALAHIEPSAPESIPVLIEALKYLSDKEISVSTVPIALSHLGPPAKAALPALIGLVKDGAEDTDLHRALVQIDPDGKECVSALISALEQDSIEIVDAAARCLGHLGPKAKDAVPALAKAVTRDFSEPFYNTIYPQTSAAKALRRIDLEGKSAVPALMRALRYRHEIVGQEPDYSTAESAAQLLGSYGPAARAAVGTLVEVVRTRDKDDANWFVREAATLALGQIRPDAKAAIPVLRDLLREFGEKSRHHPEVVIALYQLAPDGKEIAERWIEQTMMDPILARDPQALKERALVLGAMSRSSVEGDCLTRRYLQRIDRMVVHFPPDNYSSFDFLEEWFEVLGRLGIGARLAVPRLNEFRNHANPWVRMWAAEALRQISPEPIR